MTRSSSAAWRRRWIFWLKTSPPCRIRARPNCRAWFAQNSNRFALPPRVSFRHLYFSFDRGPRRSRRGAAALDKIAGKPADAPEVAAVADPFMFQDYYAERAPEQIAKEFGPDFAKAVFQLKPGAWQGPIQSGYGWHLVFVDAIEPGRVPAFEEVEPDVKSAWLDQKQREIKRTAFEAMRARYTVVVPPIETRRLGEPAESAGANRDRGGAGMSARRCAGGGFRSRWSACWWR